MADNSGYRQDYDISATKILSMDANRPFELRWWEVAYRATA